MSRHPFGILPASIVSFTIGLHSALAPAAGDPTVLALRAALAKNAAHAREWLDQKDYKSLAQSTGGLALLTELLQARSDDAAWQAAAGQLTAAIGELQAAARAEDGAKAAAALATLDKALSAAESLVPAGQPQALPRGPGIRPLMLAMGGIMGDAKIALLKGDVGAAKNQALVLSEVGKLVSNSKTGEPWTTRASAFSEAALAAATAPETDPQKVRQLLRGISQRCDACHEMRNAAR